MFNLSAADCHPANAVGEHALFQWGGSDWKRTSAEVGGSKYKQKNVDKGREGVQNPGKFADVLYEWSLSQTNFTAKLMEV